MFLLGRLCSCSRFHIHMPASSTCKRQCDCGRWYKGKNSETVRVLLHRCKQQHVADEVISFPKRAIEASNLLWVVLSHRSGRHNARILRKQLLKAGVHKKLLLVKDGFEHGKICDGGRPLKYNEVVMYNFFHRWIPAVGDFLNRTSRTILGVVYIECTARCQFQRVAELLPEINRFPSRPLKWLGYRKFHRARPERNKHPNPVYEGSKLLVFAGSSLPQVRRLYMKTKRYSHLDLFLCRSLKPSSFHAPSTSVTSSCKHLSICGGSEKGPIVRDNEAPGSRPMKWRKLK